MKIGKIYQNKGGTCMVKNSPAVGPISLTWQDPIGFLQNNSFFILLEIMEHNTGVPLNSLKIINSDGVIGWVGLTDDNIQIL